MTHDETRQESDVIIYRIERPDWYVTPVGRSLEIYDRGSDELVRIMRPPDAWGDDWGWNLCDEGVYFRRT